MTIVKLSENAAKLPEPWNSHVLDRVGPAYLKVMRMDELAGEDDVHPEPEALLVVDGRMEIAVGGVHLSVGPGELCVVPADTVHRVLAGSHGTLFLVNLNAPEHV